MQKITLTFIYGKDDTRKLKYRLTGDIPLGVMLEKLIGFQFIVDSADPKTFNVLHNGIQIEDLSKTFEECEIIDGDEIYLIPTVFDPIPPLPENDAPVKKAPKNHEKTDLYEEEHHHSHHRPNNNRQGSGRNNNNSSHNNSRRGGHSQGQQKKQSAPQGERKMQAQKSVSPASQGEKKDAPVPFKPHSRNFHRNHGRRPGNTNKPN